MSDEHVLPGGNVGGAVRVGSTVRRPTGPWTPAVHALLDHLAGQDLHTPAVRGVDDRGREVLDYLPGTVVDNETGLTDPQLVSLASWTRRFHAAATCFSHPGPWRMFPVRGATMIGHNDLAAYNVCFDGDDLVGVFDWDLAGPSTPLMELAFLAWNGVPLWRDDGPGYAARRLRLIAAAYGSGSPAAGLSAGEILEAVPTRIEIMLDGIPVAAAAGDVGMANLIAQGEPARSRGPLSALVHRIPAILQAVGAEDTLLP